MQLSAKMRCYQLNGFGEDLVEVVQETPVPKNREVLVRVLGAGVCHSDVHICEGHYDLGSGRSVSFADRVKLPRTLGHEVSGEVVAMGPDAGNVALGDKCLVCSWIGCGACEQCAEGLENLCLKPQFVGVNRDGGFAEFVLVPDAKYIVALGALDPVASAPMVCSGLTTYSAIKKFGPLQGRRPIVIMGAGGLGLIALSVAKMLDAAGTVVVEIDGAKRDAAVAAGAIAAIDPRDPDAKAKVREAVGGPVWAVLDLVGSGQTAQFGIDVLEKVGKLIVVGLFGGSIDMPIPTFPLKVLTIQGSYTGSPAELREFVDLANRKGLPSAPISKRPLGSADQALRDLRDGKVVGRAVLVPEAAP